jgi:hypothetical protein
MHAQTRLGSIRQTLARRSVVAVAAILAAVALLASNASAADWNCADKEKHTLDRTQPLNIGQLKLQLLDYKYCGGYEQEFAERIAEAKAYIQLRAKQVSKPALVLISTRRRCPIGCKSRRTISVISARAPAR